MLFLLLLRAFFLLMIMGAGHMGGGTKVESVAEKAVTIRVCWTTVAIGYPFYGRARVMTRLVTQVTARMRDLSTTQGCQRPRGLASQHVVLCNTLAN
jgi:hypothetical protein